MERYEAYRDSGVAWIGEIPEGWELSRVGWISSCLNGDRGINYPSGRDILDEGVPFVVTDALHQDTIDSSRCKYISRERYQLLGGVKLRIDDIAYCLRGSIGICAINSFAYEGTVASSLMVVRPKACIAKWLYYVLVSEAVSKQVDSYMNGTCAANLSADGVSKFRLPTPPIDEQHAIADYLDARTAEIDALVADCEQEVVLLGEYRRAVISEAVTKGLDPDAPMKDSGVEWIGEIPEGWMLKRLSACIRLVESGVSVNGASYPATKDEIGVLKTSAVYHDVFTASENKHVNPEEICRVKCPVLSDRLIVSRMNTPEWVGACGYVGEGCPNLFLPDRLWQIEINEQAVCKYVYYWLQSNGIKSWISVIAVGTSGSMKNIAQNEFGLLPIPLPSLDDQRAIVSYLDIKTAEIDSLIEAKQQMADKLREYRKSLISEAVTGKFKVPGVE